MMDAAKAGGVKHIINIGSWTVHEPTALSLLADRFVQPEDYLQTLGVGWTSLRSGYFNPNLAMAFGSLRSSDEIRFPDGLMFPPVDPRDVGYAAAAIANECVFGGADHHGKCYEISGPEMLSVADMARIFAQALDRPVTHTPVSVDEYTATLPPALAQLIHFMHDAGESAIPFSPHGVGDLTGVEAMRLEDWVREHKGRFEREG